MISEMTVTVLVWIFFFFKLRGKSDQIKGHLAGNLYCDISYIANTTFKIPGIVKPVVFRW